MVYARKNFVPFSGTTVEKIVSLLSQKLNYSKRVIFFVNLLRYLSEITYFHTAPPVGMMYRSQSPGNTNNMNHLGNI